MSKSLWIEGPRCHKNPKKIQVVKNKVSTFFRKKIIKIGSRSSEISSTKRSRCAGGSPWPWGLRSLFKIWSQLQIATQMLKSITFYFLFGVYTHYSTLLLSNKQNVQHSAVSPHLSWKTVCFSYFSWNKFAFFLDYRGLSFLLTLFF